MGLLGSSALSGIVITPACDLGKNKTETVTYLPVLPIRAYFSSNGVLPMVRTRTQNLLKSLRFAPRLDWGSGEFRCPMPLDIEYAIGEIDDYLAAKQRGEAEAGALIRVQVGLNILAAIGHPDLTEIETSRLANFFGSEWDPILRKIITNAFSSDLHFLPADGQNPAFSGVPRHSVVLFRYPITVPIEVLDLARDANQANWSEVVSRNLETTRALHNYRSELPVKCLSLRPDFLSDLLSRYVSMYNRIGSPDFTLSSITRIVREV